MIPQSSFMVLAPVDRAREAELRALLATMNTAPGYADPSNKYVPFGRFDDLHVARFVLLDDKTVGDIAIYGVTPTEFPLYLAFVGDIDTSAGAFLAQLANECSAGLRSIFSCCVGFDAKDSNELLRWMKRHNVASAANYVNWRGRTVRRAKEEAALADAIQSYLAQNGAAVCAQPARDVHKTLRQFTREEIDAGRLELTPDPPTPISWRVENFLHLVGVPIAALIASPVLIPVGIIAALRLRALEKTDPELCGAVDQTYSSSLAEIEDHDVTNQFTAMGSLKPGLWRRLMALTAFFAIDYAARHLYTRGGLARVRTIHFARWVFLDDQQRVVFMSNYDGSLESYMDDFINKVGFGLNVAFSAGVGYPRTNWFVLDGCGDERKFKEYLRRHQVPTQVWYKAHPGLTAVDLERNGRIRTGLDAPTLTDTAAREWVALL
jgi:hypothetical protein